ncbi:MAG: hypothetical protein ONB42_20315, partial [candidate division KSB1 bacterium]|nr:hypothetical protein [candidate division KSB1 bacterium]
MKTQLQKLDRRNFMRTVAGGLGGFAASSWLAPAPPALARPMENARAAFNNLKITELKFLKLQFPGKTPVKRNAIITSGGEAPSLKMLELYTNQGLIGRSLPKGPDSLIKSAFSKSRGENPFDVERLWDRMYRDNRKPVAKGEYIEAIGSLDMAIWDLIGKALELPVYRVLGAYQTRLRVYAAGGYYEEGKTVADLVKEMEGYVSEGFR